MGDPPLTQGDLPVGDPPLTKGDLPVGDPPLTKGDLPVGDPPSTKGDLPVGDAVVFFGAGLMLAALGRRVDLRGEMSDPTTRVVP